MADAVTVNFDPPVSLDGKPVDKLVFSPPTIGDVIAYEESEGGETRKTTVLLARCAGVDVEAFMKLPAVAFKKVIAETSEMLGND